MIDQALVAAPPVPLEAPFNVRPCRTDPLFGLLEDRSKLSSAQVAGLFLLFYFGIAFLSCWVSGTAFPRPDLQYCFTQDISRIVFNALLLPGAAFLATRFYRQAEETFERLYSEGIIRAPREAYDAFLMKLDRRFNSLALHVCVAIAAVSFRLNDTYHSNRDSTAEWIDLRYGVGAYYHLAINFVSWYFGLLFVCKVIIAARAMRRIFDWPVTVQPFHPDGCGGLRRLTDMSITIALCVGLASFGVVTFLWIGKVSATSLPVVVAVCLICLTPLVFLSCVYGAHRAMVNAKEAMLWHVNRQIQPSYQTLCSELSVGKMPTDAAESIIRLESLHAVIRRMPVWPVNTQTVAQVSLSVAVPFLLLLLQVVLDRSLGK